MRSAAKNIAPYGISPLSCSAEYPGWGPSIAETTPVESRLKRVGSTSIKAFGLAEPKLESPSSWPVYWPLESLMDR